MKQTKVKTTGGICQTAVKPKITYAKLFWLFMVGSLIGVVMEGVYCVFVHGGWQTHVVSMWGPFCILYGIGAAGFYAGTVLLWKKNAICRFVFFAVVADLVELAAGLLLEFGLKMRAWDYTGQFLNFRGHISLPMTFAWGAIGTAFSYTVPLLERVFAHMEHYVWRILCVLLSLFMAANLLFTAFCIVRWKNRHFGVPPKNQIEQMIDERYDDEYMQKRFCEWRFLTDRETGEYEVSV